MTGLRRPSPARVLALFLAVGLAGCHLPGGLPMELGPGRGRVDRTYPASLSHSVRATIAALDDLGVHPKGLIVRAIDASSDIGKPGWKDETNAEYLPDNQSYRDLFDLHRMSGTSEESIPFNPVLITYQGETAEGQAVHVVVRSEPPDASKTLIMTRVGRDGDEGWSGKLLDRVADHLKEKAPALPALPPAQ